jgi:serine/threonine-protein phosphatase PGAM5
MFNFSRPLLHKASVVAVVAVPAILTVYKTYCESDGDGKWDYNWDRKAPPNVTEVDAYYTEGVCRHVILVRHGQYEETSEEDSDRRLTALGKMQARRTGQRLAELMRGGYHDYPPTESRPNREDHHCSNRAQPAPISRIFVSDLTRAKETAAIILEELQEVNPKLLLESPDADLNEAWPPAPIIPIRPDIDEKDQHYQQADESAMERAYKRYFYRGEPGVEPRDEFIIVVGHANVNRYLFLRALQLPPCAWLRMSTFNCSLTYLLIRPNGYVSARLLGDVGHMPYDETTFSGSHGFAW